MTIGDLIELAQIGRNRILEDHKKNVISWLGSLPSHNEIETAGNYIYHHIRDSFGPISAQEITNPLED